MDTNKIIIAILSTILIFYWALAYYWFLEYRHETEILDKIEEEHQAGMKMIQSIDAKLFIISSSVYDINKRLDEWEAE